MKEYEFTVTQTRVFRGHIEVEDDVDFEDVEDIIRDEENWPDDYESDVRIDYEEV